MRLAARCLALLLCATPASATPIALDFRSSGGTSAGWGHDFIHFEDWFERVERDGVLLDVDFTATVTGALTLTSLESEVGDDGIVRFSKATYAGGVFELRAEGRPVLAVPIRNFVLEVGEISPIDQRVGDLYLTLGSGRLDPIWARSLGVSRRVLGGEYWLGLDVVLPPFEELGGEWERQAVWNGSELDLTVPEPATVLLLLVSVGAAARRGRWRLRKALLTIRRSGSGS